MERRGGRALVLPINQIFKFFTSGCEVEIWLKKQNRTRVIGKIVGFDEYMNLVLSEAKIATRRKDSLASEPFASCEQVGHLLLKGENILLVSATAEQSAYKAVEQSPYGRYLVKQRSAA